MDILIGFGLSVVFLLSLGGAVLGFMAWRETRKNRTVFATGLKAMADLIEAQARSVRLDPSQTGSPALRALAADMEAGLERKRGPQKERQPTVRMRPLEDHEEWALEQKRKGYAGLSDEDEKKARNWVAKIQQERVALSEA